MYISDCVTYVLIDQSAILVALNNKLFTIIQHPSIVKEQIEQIVNGHCKWLQLIFSRLSAITINNS